MMKLTLADLHIETQITPQVAEIHIGLQGKIDSQLVAAEWIQWSGKVRGPFSAFSQTLPANYPLRASQSGGKCFAIVPDFCHWSAVLPFTYELDLEVRHGSQVLASLKETIAANWVRLHQGKLYQAAKRWVPRLTKLNSVEPIQLPLHLSALRSQELGVVVSAADVSDELLLACQSMGIPLAIELVAGREIDLTRIENFACVLLLLESPMAKAPATKLLVASAAEALPSISAWRWSLRRGGTLSASGNAGQLIIRAGVHETPSEARHACDQLQAMSSELGDWAAYIS